MREKASRLPLMRACASMTIHLVSSASSGKAGEGSVTPGPSLHLVHELHCKRASIRADWCGVPRGGDRGVAVHHEARPPFAYHGVPYDTLVALDLLPVWHLLHVDVRTAFALGGMHGPNIVGDLDPQVISHEVHACLLQGNSAGPFDEGYKPITCTDGASAAGRGAGALLGVRAAGYAAAPAPVSLGAVSVTVGGVPVALGREPALQRQDDAVGVPALLRKGGAVAIPALLRACGAIPVGTGGSLGLPVPWPVRWALAISGILRVYSVSAVTTWMRTAGAPGTLTARMTVSSPLHVGGVMASKVLRSECPKEAAAPAAPLRG
mmetsp:Transcript_116066/g.323302  ORF Transcript_116066/g.323302 Transcript_116066/m.323302 type:complete len:322 (+) Transcript_116066:40-1005(+)